MPWTPSSRSAERPRILQVLPRGMRYSRFGATSIDLFVCEVASHSRLDVEVIAETDGEALSPHVIHRLPSYRIANTWRRSLFVGDVIRGSKIGAVVVQQHLPSAASVSRRTTAPVVLQKHNYMKAPRTSWSGRISRANRVRQLDALAGITFVSNSVLNQFENDWPEAKTPRRVIPNGIDFDAWMPKTERAKNILVVGRASPEKGLLEAALALREILALHSNWRATFVVSEPDRFSSYFRALIQTVEPLGDRAEVLVGQPFSDVKALNESAAIAIIPSLWKEPFGRTCLEAHAGGATVVSSGTGGLRQVSGDTALYLDAVDPLHIYNAVEILIKDDLLRNRLAREGRARVEQMFDIRDISGFLDDFCIEVIDRHARQSGSRLP